MSDGYGSTPFEELIPPPTEVNNTNRDTSIAISIIILGVLTIFVVSARLAQRYLSKNLGPDDYAIVPAVLFYLGWTAAATYFNLHSGLGKPLGEITYGEFIAFYKGIFVAAWMYPVVSATIRASVLLFYRRIFAKGNRFYTIFIWVMLFLQLAYVIVFEITPGFSCHPIQDGWNPLLRYTSCTDFYIWQTEALYGASIAFDVILLLFPVYAVWKLQMPLKKRLGTAFIFALGATASIVASYKLAIFVYESTDFDAPTPPNWYSYQASYYIFPQYNDYGRVFWLPTHIEPTVALIGTSMPAMLQVYSAALLQFTKLRSRLSSQRGSETARTYRNDTPGKNSSSFRFRTEVNNKFQEVSASGSAVELNPMPSFQSIRSEAQPYRFVAR